MFAFCIAKVAFLFETTVLSSSFFYAVYVCAGKRCAQYGIL